MFKKVKLFTMAFQRSIVMAVKETDIFKEVMLMKKFICLVGVVILCVFGFTFRSLSKNS